MTTLANVAAIRRALEDAGVEFTNEGQPGVRLKARGVEGLEDVPAFLKKDGRGK